jgi:hypothetical protein
MVGRYYTSYGGFPADVSCCLNASAQTSAAKISRLTLADLGPFYG